MLITDDPITDFKSNCKKNSILLSVLSLSWSGTELLTANWQGCGAEVNEELDFDRNCGFSRSEKDVY